MEGKLKSTRPLNENRGCSSFLFGRKQQTYSAQNVPADEEETDSLPYLVNKKFLSYQEASFYKLAREVLQGKYTVCPKVSLSELFYINESDRSRWQIYRNKIDRKTVDFVVCDSASMKPIYAIELDDPSHERPDRQERDQFVEAVFATAQLPLVRIRGQYAYTHEELVEQLLTPLQNIQNVSAERPAPPPVQENQADVPVCPTCGSSMRKRKATAGTHAGEIYWICTNYPICQTYYPAGEFENT